MKNKVFIILVIMVLLALNPLNAYAQAPGPTPTPTIEVVGNKATVPFSQLGFRDDTLSSPFDVTRVLFSIPPNWRLSEGGEIDIDYDILFSGTDISKLVDGVNPYGGTLTITFNQKVIGTIPLDKAGSNTAVIKIPPEALVSARDDGRHQLNIALGAQFSCLYDLRANVVIKASSKFVLPFEASAPILDLAKLPAPFYLENALIPAQNLVVISDNPSPVELQSALNIMAGFGSLIGTNFGIELVNANALTNDALKASNLIFVGKPDGLSQLSKVALPLPVTGGKYANIPASSGNDGILQMALSPWNPDKVVLVVSGNSDDAVARAAFAVSSGRVFTYDNPVLSYVSNVQLLAKNIPVVEDFSLKDLGYQTVTLTGVGLLSTEFTFSAAKEQVGTREGYIDLAFYHSGLLDYGQSSLSVSLNGQVINGTPFSKDTEKLTTLRINIPAGLLRFGLNRLAVSARMLTTDSCDSSGFSNPWLTISDQTRIHIPAGSSTSAASQFILDLKSFPAFFLTQSDLGDVAFVLPKGNADAVRIAGKLAYNFGVAAVPGLPNLSAAFADGLTDEIKNTKSLIVIGKASSIPLLSQINDRLPAPFDLKENTASEKDMQVSYRIPAGISVGYLELITSPFNSEKVILSVAGNTDQGVNLAGNALVQPDLTSQLAGLFAVTNGTKIATGATPSMFSIVSGAVPGAEPVVNQPLTPGVSTRLAIPLWLVPFLIASAAVIAVVLAYVLIKYLLRRRTPKL